MHSGAIFLSFEGRLDRERWLGAAGLFVAIVVATYLATWALAREGAISPGAREAIRTFVQIALLVPWFALDWKRFHELNFVNRDYKPFDASRWPPRDAGLLGPVRLVPLAHLNVTPPADR